jgi:hypothetical protein
MTDDVSSEKPLVVYQVTSQHWAHAEQIRWTLLYNLLVTNTILVLAWAAIFSTSTRTVTTRMALICLCVVGAVVSSLWVFLERRANGFSRRYTELGQEVEKSLRVDRGPFQAAESHRGKLEGFTAHTQTYIVLTAVPGLFVVLFLVLVILSICG